jgi:hypothetical protein
VELVDLLLDLLGSAWRFERTDGVDSERGPFAGARVLPSDLGCAGGLARGRRGGVDRRPRRRPAIGVAVSDLAAASVAAASAALADLIALRRGQTQRPVVEVDRRRASLWFGSSLRPDGWWVPPAWDAVAGDYPTRDGWIRLEPMPRITAPWHLRS